MKTLHHMLRTGLTLTFSFLVLCCRGVTSDPNSSHDDPATGWVLSETYNMSIPEPSGLAWDSAGGHLWTVSDRTGRIHAISFAGEVLRTLTWEGVDLEAIAVRSADRSLFVAEERTAAIYHLDSTGVALGKIQLDSVRLGGSDGLEGLAYCESSGTLFVLKEANPGLLLEITLEGEVLHEHELSFARDYSGMDILEGDTLLIVSDRDRAVYRLLVDGTLLSSEPLPGIVNPEGVAYVNDTLYVVSDSGGYLAKYIYVEE